MSNSWRDVVSYCQLKFLSHKNTPFWPLLFFSDFGHHELVFRAQFKEQLHREAISRVGPLTLKLLLSYRILPELIQDPLCVCWRLLIQGTVSRDLVLSWVSQRTQFCWSVMRGKRNQNAFTESGKTNFFYLIISSTKRKKMCHSESCFS